MYLNLVTKFNIQTEYIFIPSSSAYFVLWPTWRPSWPSRWPTWRTINAAKFEVFKKDQNMIFCENYLVNKITNDMKDDVIRRYLQGESRNDIARTCGLGEGTVSNIEDEWKHSLGIPDVQSLRELAVNLKRCGIDALQCAEGLKILNTIRKLGVNENELQLLFPL